MRKDLSMLMDLYEATMANGLTCDEYKNTICYFDMFFRRVPDDGGFAIMAGLEQLINYLEGLEFSKDDIEYFRSLNLFQEEFLNYLDTFKFTCNVWAIPEGTPIFPLEPIITVRGPAVQTLLIETMLLLTINHQSLIATKANRIVRAAQSRDVFEFGSRRAHGFDAAVFGARAAYIGGCVGTSCVKAGKDFDIPVNGTMAHSWVQMFDTEYEAFKKYAECYPNSCLLLVDTYNTLKSGIPNAIKAFDEVLKPLGCRPKGIRIDSGDITYLTKKARKMLDDAGYPDCAICASNALDEYLIRDMLMQGARVDIFGVGERLITAASEAVFGGVYKLSAIETVDGKIIPKIKISENVSKITLPCFKQCWRLFDRESGKAIADVVTLASEEIDDTKPYEIFDQNHVWKRKKINKFIARKLQCRIFDHGNLVYKSPSATEIQSYRSTQVESLWEEVQRFEKPHTYYVDLSEKLWAERNKLLEKYSV
ncbi:MAG: nicotinate phosphoribosyltransferase [Oscillospiraceae bacterium]|nr:nicotinate phosphoribosyltransferase [Oscillospiraceae bacterium]